MLRLPQLAGRWIESKPFLAALPDRPNFRQRARRMSIWVIGSGLSVRCNVDDLAEIVVQFLCDIPGCGTRAVAIAYCHKQSIVFADCDTPACFGRRGKIVTCRNGGASPKDNLHIAHCVCPLVEAGPSDVRIARVAVDPVK